MKTISNVLGLALGVGIVFNAFSAFAQVPEGAAAPAVTVPGPADEYTLLLDALQRHCEEGSQTKSTWAKYKREIPRERSLAHVNVDLAQHALCGAIAAKNPGLCGELKFLSSGPQSSPAPGSKPSEGNRSRIDVKRSRLDCLASYHIFQSALAAKAADAKRAVEHCRQFFRYWDESFGLYGETMEPGDDQLHKFLTKNKDAEGGYCSEFIGYFKEGDAKTACAGIFKAAGGGWPCEAKFQALDGEPGTCNQSVESYVQHNCKSLSALLSIYRGKGDAGCQELPLCQAALASSAKSCQSYADSSVRNFCKVWSSSRIDELATRKTVDPEIKAVIKALEKKRGK